MIGLDLYVIWYEKMADQGIQVDTWDELPDSDQAAWDHVAAAVAR